MGNQEFISLDSENFNDDDSFRRDDVHGVRAHDGNVDLNRNTINPVRSPDIPVAMWCGEFDNVH